MLSHLAYSDRAVVIVYRDFLQDVLMPEDSFFDPCLRVAWILLFWPKACVDAKMRVNLD